MRDLGQGREAMVEPIPGSSNSDAWGDLLVVFRGDAGVLPARDSASPWRHALDEGTRGLMWQPSSSHWSGYPVRILERAPWRLWLLGEIYGSGTERAAGDLAMGVAEGSRPAVDLNGHLLMLGWNESERRWHVWTDRFGTVHAYLSDDGSRAALGTYLPAVAAAASRRRLDWQGLCGFMAFGFFPEDRTFFDDVKILRPATHYVLDANGALIRAERYWRWRHEPDGRRSHADTVEEFAAVFHRVLDDQSANGRLAVPISGGLDSRSTVAALTRPGREPGASVWSYSYGYTDGSVETRIAREIAEARGLPFEAVTVGPYLFDRLGLVLSCVEGFQDLTQSRQATVAGRLARDADAVIAAHWGDVWLDSMGLVGAETADPSAVVDHALRKIRKRGRDWLLAELVAPRLGREPDSLLREIVGTELDRVGEIADADFRVKAFKTEQWSFRWTLASLRMFQAGAFPRLPFYDTRLTDFFSTVPSALMKGRRLQVDYLKRFAPDLARITWQAYDTNLFLYPYFHSLLLPSRAIKKAMRLLRADAPQRNWEVQFSGDAGRRGLEQTLLRENSKLHEFVDPRRIRSLLRDFLSSPLEEGRGYTVSMLLTFSSWLEAHG